MTWCCRYNQVGDEVLGTRAPQILRPASTCRDREQRGRAPALQRILTPAFRRLFVSSPGQTLRPEARPGPTCP